MVKKTKSFVFIFFGGMCGLIYSQRFLTVIKHFNFFNNVIFVFFICLRNYFFLLFIFHTIFLMLFIFIYNYVLSFIQSSNYSHSVFIYFFFCSYQCLCHKVILVVDLNLGHFFAFDNDMGTCPLSVYLLEWFSFFSLLNILLNLMAHRYNIFSFLEFFL